MQAVAINAVRVAPTPLRRVPRPARRALCVVRASADLEPKQLLKDDEHAAAATTALLATAGLLAPLLLDTESALAVPDIIKGRTFSLIHPGARLSE